MIPLAITTITVLRHDPDVMLDEPYDGSTPADRTEVVTGLRAVIDRPHGTEQAGTAEQSLAGLALCCDPVDLRYTDLVKDDGSGLFYEVVWLLAFPEHVEAGLKHVEGVQ